ncbi:hypothetical protein V5O48_012396 [Marasmius crinis-equi]|uniref:Uncharacterized protein n=1 Tax=Marasmius crinis-equi TaxID=585013 RepID=A0ABR3F2Y6_9AGAR
MSAPASKPASTNPKRPNASANTKKRVQGATNTANEKAKRLKVTNNGANTHQNVNPNPGPRARGHALIAQIEKEKQAALQKEVSDSGTATSAAAAKNEAEGGQVLPVSAPVASNNTCGDAQQAPEPQKDKVWEMPPYPKDPIPKPNGEPGSKKKGYNLQAAMGLRDDRTFVRHGARRVGVDYKKSYKNQDPEVKDKLIKWVTKYFPYVDKKHFAIAWPTTEELKCHIQHVRKHGSRRARGVVGSSNANNAGQSGDDEDKDKETGGNDDNSASNGNDTDDT